MRPLMSGTVSSLVDDVALGCVCVLEMQTLEVSWRGVLLANQDEVGR
jgi:hypothetical protein